MTSKEIEGSGTSRRGLMRFAAFTGVASAASLATSMTVSSVQAHASDGAAAGFPDDFIYPPVTGPALALWGSSSFEGAQAEQGVPAGVDAKIDTLLHSYLQVPVLNFGRGGETSTQINARRGTPQNIFKLVFPQDTVPASGSVEVTLAEGSNVAFGSTVYAPGFVGDVPGTLTATAKTGTYLFTRTVPGSALYAPADTPAGWFRSYQEMISRACYHIIQIGRNNLGESKQIRQDTQNAFDMAPERTLVLGHFRSRGDAADSDRAKNTEDYNAWAAQEYGKLFINPETYLRETTQEGWLRYGALAGSGVWASDEDHKAYSEGKIPPSLYASDGLHLNGWGYTALAQMLYYKLLDLGWF